MKNVLEGQPEAGRLVGVETWCGSATTGAVVAEDVARGTTCRVFDGGSAVR
ncbi:hypothetical protein [Umezawaea sp. Da 62-37]|uniref:hypothetical protein n=1 Tax=Umezawaea sp. Da 62-37 TaxID=3075927 RepID=UPI0028F72E86|nr:hypothetical protein [Umezawaea sp. Da 62-37]WNV87523.1 hypothetical protein RM788_04260 [Umezawaea sp. Da 62-37]